MSTTESNKAVVKDFIDGLFTKGDLGAVDTYLAEDFVNHDPPFGVTADREGMRTAASMMRAAFPDWHSELHALIAEGDLVVERFTAGGTHRGEVMGVPATGKVDQPAGDQHLPAPRRSDRGALGTARRSRLSQATRCRTGVASRSWGWGIASRC